MLHSAYILLGSNLGNPLQSLEKACQLIEKAIGAISHSSAFYKTEAWGNTNQNSFLNQVVLVQTELPPNILLEKLLTIENEMGRTRNIKWEARIIDLDILFYDDLIINDPNLIIPHPFIQDRRFTLIPLVEIAPNWVHPVFKKQMIELLAICNDNLKVEKIDKK